MSAANRVTRCTMAFGVCWAAVGGCAAHQSRADREQQEIVRLNRFRVLDICFRSSGATTFEAGLPWASQEDVAYYRAEREQEENTQPLGLE